MPCKRRKRKLPVPEDLGHGSPGKVCVKSQNLDAQRSEAKEGSSNSTSEDDMFAVLMRMEGPGVAREGSSAMDWNGDSSEEECEWEEVPDHPLLNTEKSQLPSGSVKIRLEVPDIMKKKRKRDASWREKYYSQLLNRYVKNRQISLHKVHLLCLLAHGLHCVHLCNSPVIRALALSLEPCDIPRKRVRLVELPTLTKLTKYFFGLIVIDPEQHKSPVNEDTLVRKFCTKVATEKEFVLLFFAFLSMLGFDTRLIMSLVPLSPKVPLQKVASGEGQNSGKEKKKAEKTRVKDHADSAIACSSKDTSGGKSLHSSKSAKGKLSKAARSEDNHDSSRKQSKYFKERHNLKKKGSEKKAKGQTAEKMEKIPKVLKSGGEKESHSGCRSSEPRRSSRNFRSKTRECGDSNYSHEKTKTERSARKGKANKEQTMESEEILLSSSEDFEEEPAKSRTPTYSLKKKYKGKNVSRKILSSESSEESLMQTEDEQITQGTYLWVEVYLETERKWICVDVIHNVVNKPEMMEKWVKHEMTYVVGFCNDGSVKDVTPFYASQWLTHTHKQRVDPGWWDETLAPYRSHKVSREKTEDDFLRVQLMMKALPSTIGDYKNHPLYALSRHLLKFEAIYPETAVPVGFIKNEPVYARECVHTLHSRENWMKEGRVVKLGETAYKMVKSRPKWKKPKENPDELDLELFGEWQTEIYVPPPPKDGKIYRNEYGNIELFRPTMLPAGTVHIRIDGLKKVAKKLDIDCVPAMVGWEHHMGYAHPILDGFVVCKEHEELLLTAWDEEQEIQRQKDIEKKEKRVYGNWKRLIRGLLIQEKLKKRYSLETPAVAKRSSAKASSDEKATDLALTWPQNRRTAKGKGAPKKCIVEVETL